MTAIHDQRRHLVLVSYAQWPALTLYSTQAPWDAFEI